MKNGLNPVFLGAKAIRGIVQVAPQLFRAEPAGSAGPTPQKKTIIIDEPELGLHPVAISALAGMLRLAKEECQLDPAKFDSIPEYLVSECNLLLTKAQ